ncbi:MAG: TetR/AcrR family transcriptional regulator [Pseudonocardia sp.]
MAAAAEGKEMAGTTRRSQQDRARATRAALVAAGRRLFAERGYANVPAEEIVAAAGVTRGALHHHYGDKQGLFRGVFEELETEIAGEIAAAVDAAPDPRAGMALALARFLDLCTRPDVARIALTDAPAVLGWSTWRSIEAEHGLGLMTRGLQEAADRGHLTDPPPSIPVLAQLVLSAVIEAALVIGHATDPAAARDEVEQGLLTILSAVLPEA